MDGNGRNPERIDHLRRGSDVSPYISAFAGSISGLVARLCTAPLDVVKIRLQLQVKGHKYRGIVGTMKTVVKEEGALALWKGNVPAAAMYIIYGAVQFSSYSFYNSLFTDWQSQCGLRLGAASHSFVVGSLAGCTSTFMSYPCDLLRTRFVNNHTRFSRVSTTISEILRNEGPMGFFKGVNTAMLSVSLYTGMVFWCYQTARTISQKIEVYQSIVEPVCGFTAGAVAKGVVFPLDLLRKRFQINKARNRNFIFTGLSIIKAEGLGGLYKGCFVSLIKSAPTTALSIWTYQSILRLCI